MDGISRLDTAHYKSAAKQNVLGKVINASSLSLKERIVLCEIKEIISSLNINTEVFVGEEKKLENGLRLEVIGLVGYDASGRDVFSINETIVKKMSEDESYKAEMLEEIRKLADNKKQTTTTNETESKQKGISPANISSSFFMDFWNEDDEKSKLVVKKLLGHSVQSVASKYEGNLAFGRK